MKNIVLIVAVLSFYGAIGQKKSSPFIVSGHVSDRHIAFVYLAWCGEDGNYRTDSIAPKNGVFRFTGHITEQQMASLATKADSGKSQGNYTRFFLAPGNTRVEAAGPDFNEAVITGNAVQQEWADYSKKRNKIDQRWKIVLDTLAAVNKRSNFQFQELKRWVLAPRRQELDELRGGHIAAHPNSYVTVYLLQYNADVSTDSLQKVYDRFSVSVKQSMGGRNILEALNKRTLGVPGTAAAAFTTKDINGQTLSLSDYKGKYVLLDFWASWCVPCRKDNPHLRELYAKYKDKGLEFIGVASDDSKPDAWRKAVTADSLPWKQVLSGRQIKKDGDNTPVGDVEYISKGYNIMTLPTQVLIDPHGKIIARYGDRGEDHALLDKKLRVIFGE